MIIIQGPKMRVRMAEGQVMPNQSLLIMILNCRCSIDLSGSGFSLASVL